MPMEPRPARPRFRGQNLQSAGKGRERAHTGRWVPEDTYNRVCSFVVVILYEQKWAEAKKPIHRFLNRVPLQMSSRRKQQMMPLFDWRLSWLSLRKRIVFNAGKFRFVHRHPDNLSLSNFSISRRSIDRSDSRNDTASLHNTLMHCEIGRSNII